MLEYPIYSGHPFWPWTRSDGEIKYQFIIGVDPGPEDDYGVAFDLKNGRIVHVGVNMHFAGWVNSLFVVEKIMSYGMAVSTSIFKTVFKTGVIEMAVQSDYSVIKGNSIAYVARKDVKMHFCNSMRAKDTNIRAALIDRFGEPGTKKNPGILYGIKKDWWAALAVAVYAADWLQQQQSNRIGG